MINLIKLLTYETKIFIFYDKIRKEILFRRSFPMKRYLTAIFIALSILTLIIGLRIDVIWSGIVSWGLVIILLSFAAFFTKYIPNEEKEKRNSL